MASSNQFKILLGDIHNHNTLGYGVGSLEHGFDIALTHLDFFAFAGHSSRHDMENMEGGREQHWIEEFERLRDGWGHVQDIVAGSNVDGEFGVIKPPWTARTSPPWNIARAPAGYSTPTAAPTRKPLRPSERARRRIFDRRSVTPRAGPRT